MNDIKPILDRDRLLWIALALLAGIVLASIVFSPPEWTPPPDPYAGDPSFSSETLQGRVTQIVAQETFETEAGTQYVQQVEVKITKGSLKGQLVVTEHGSDTVSNSSSQVKPGMRVIVEHTTGPAGERFYISDFVRRPALWTLVLLFIALTVAIGRWTGVRSLIGTAFSVLVIARFILPRILAGQNPVLVSIAGAVLILVPSLYLVYGWQPKTHAAVLGMGICLLITWILAAIFVRWTHMTGFGSQESTFLIVALQREVDLRGLVLSGVILGTLGVLDDVTTTQASAVLELHAANPTLSWRELFRRGMVIGRDHIASMVNTLLMAYVGASLPLFLLLVVYQEPLSMVLNRELMAEEVVRTLVGSMGLILAVPVTSLIASWMASRQAERPGDRTEPDAASAGD